MPSEPCTRGWSRLLDGYTAYLEARARDDELRSDYLERGDHASETCGHGPFVYEGEPSAAIACTAAVSALHLAYAHLVINKERMHSAYERMVEGWERYRDGKCPPEERDDGTR